MESGKVQLSKNLKQMKFMQRKYGAEVKALEEEEQRKRVDDDHWVLDLPEITVKESQFEEDKSFSSIHNLRFGRVSYKGMNQKIEKIMKNLELENQLKESEAKEREMMITDEEMAERYSSLVNTMGKKFQSKRARTNTMEETNAKRVKKEFQKPPDE